MTPEEFKELVKPENLEFLRKHSGDKPDAFALKFSNNHHMPVRAVAEQIKCRRRALIKLPDLSERELLYDSVALEQASGQAAAVYKASLFGGKNFIDITGGLGIDCYYISRNFSHSVYCELKEQLFLLAGYNMKLLEAGNITLRNGDGVGILSEFPDDYFDLIYIDPARRDNDRRYTDVKHYSPDVTSYYNLFLKKSRSVMIKISPAAEIEEVRREIPGVSEFQVISVDGECKEILVILRREESGGSNTTPKIKSVSIDSRNNKKFILENNLEISNNKPISQKVKEYFLEPDSAIIKSRLSYMLCDLFNSEFVNNQVDYLTSENAPDDFPGRVFAVREIIDYGKLKTYLKYKRVRKANIARRNFPDSPDIIKKKLNLSDGGDLYLFFTKDISSRLICVICKKQGHIPEDTALL